MLLPICRKKRLCPPNAVYELHFVGKRGDVDHTLLPFMAQSYDLQSLFVFFVLFILSVFFWGRGVVLVLFIFFLWLFCCCVVLQRATSTQNNF